MNLTLNEKRDCADKTGYRPTELCLPNERCKQPDATKKPAFDDCINKKMEEKKSKRNTTMIVVFVLVLVLVGVGYFLYKRNRQKV